MRQRSFTTLTASLVLAAVFALGLPHDDSLGKRSPATKVSPGTDSTVMLASERQKVVKQQDERLASASRRFRLPDDSPGEMYGGGCGASDVPLRDRTNSWTAGGAKGGKYLSVTLCAGAYRRNPNSGYFLIVRDRYPGATLRFYQAFVPQAGAVSITNAPLGKEGSKHVWDAHIEFEGALGTKGYLDLSDDSIHITQPPTSCPPDASGMPPNCSEAKLEILEITPKRRVVKPGKLAEFTVKIINTGEANAWDFAICREAKPKLLTANRWCRSPYALALKPGETATMRFKVRVKKKTKRGKKITLNFSAISNNTDSAHAQATIRVK